LGDGGVRFPPAPSSDGLGETGMEGKMMENSGKTMENNGTTEGMEG